MDLADLRELFLQAEESQQTRYVAIALSAGFLLFVLRLVRRRKLREEFTPIWLAVSITLMVVSLRLDLLRWVMVQLGAWTVSSTLYFLGLMFLLVFSLHASVKLSRQSLQIKNLVQEMALLRSEAEKRGESEPRRGE